jgi:peptidylprolyl isomerase
MANEVKTGDTIAVHYTGKLTDGTVFDTSHQRGPLKLTVGEQRVIPGFEQAVLGMNEGESKSTFVTADEAYGPHLDSLVAEFTRDQIPDGLDLPVGSQVQVKTTAGETMTARVVDTSGETVTLDANHPLAGQDLTFDIELVEILTSP